jgi:hypothetical protein
MVLAELQRHLNTNRDCCKDKSNTFLYTKVNKLKLSLSNLASNIKDENVLYNCVKYHTT